MDEIPGQARLAAAPVPLRAQFSAADMGALAHLYRGEMYRSKIWRTRLDTTTNWAIVTTGIALSLTFHDERASPLPLVLVGLLVVVFLIFEARRYRYFDVWRVRVRVMEKHFFGPILRGQGMRVESGWNEALARDYQGLCFHISFLEAAGRRLRRNYSWILGIQVVAYAGKLAIHPEPLSSFAELWQRAAIGPIPGQLVLLAGLLFHGAWLALALLTLRGQKAAGRVRARRGAGDRLHELAAAE
jgi:uncharacterized membrane protein